MTPRAAGHPSVHPLRQGPGTAPSSRAPIYCPVLLLLERRLFCTLTYCRSLDHQAGETESPQQPLVATFQVVHQYSYPFFVAHAFNMPGTYIISVVMHQAAATFAFLALRAIARSSPPPHSINTPFPPLHLSLAPYSHCVFSLPIVISLMTLPGKSTAAVPPAWSLHSLPDVVRVRVLRVPYSYSGSKP